AGGALLQIPGVVALQGDAVDVVSLPSADLKRRGQRDEGAKARKASQQRTGLGHDLLGRVHALGPRFHPQEDARRIGAAAGSVAEEGNRALEIRILSDDVADRLYVLDHLVERRPLRRPQADVDRVVVLFWNESFWDGPKRPDGCRGDGNEQHEDR